MSGAKPEFLQVARVLKSNGTEGGVLVGFRGIDPEDLNLKEPVFITFDGLPVPFFIESFERRGTSRAFVRLTGVKNLEDADELSGRDVAVRPETLNEYSCEEDGLDLDGLVGWSVLDASEKHIGTITGYEDIPGNTCLYVETSDGQEVMVPLHEDLILSVDEMSETLSLVIPEGLF